jgi:predicted alpha-1,2-mannosidase
VNRKELAKDYFNKSSNWKNLWRNKDTLGIKGFIMPKDIEGAWVEDENIFSFTKTHTWGDFFYEGTTWVYSLFAPHDVAGLIEISGGEQAFIKRLDHLFDHNHFDITNEPSFLIPVLYNWTDKPWKTAERVYELKRKYFYPTYDGLPGNDDSGAMSAWYVFHTLGFYPLAGSDIYLISTPGIDSATIFHAGDTISVKVKRPNKKSIYVKSLKLGNKSLNRYWITHSELVSGKPVVFEMTDNPDKAMKNIVKPYSLSTTKR